jgi:hypothetical protein
VQLNAPVIPAILRSANKRITAQADPGIKWDPISKRSNVKRASRVAQVIEFCLASGPEFKLILSKNNLEYKWVIFPN